ncbi:hypothetical protein AB0M68_20390 [Streptomyces sp. NPDC051453]|uniref:hypothetical protein n=1 Tax=Streptomyces sp. NPDC051453 TaxID=3154941 RepID=UPI0034189835
MQLVEVGVGTGEGAGGPQIGVDHSHGDARRVQQGDAALQSGVAESVHGVAGFEDLADAAGGDGLVVLIIDDRQAYEAVLDAIQNIDEARAETFRRTTRWRRGRELREPLDKAPVTVLAAVEAALAALPHAHTAG